MGLAMDVKRPLCELSSAGPSIRRRRTHDKLDGISWPNLHINVDAIALAMVVDKRVDDAYNTIKPREVQITFSQAVKSIEILGKGQSRKVNGRTVKLTLKAGGGQLLRLNGTGL